MFKMLKMVVRQGRSKCGTEAYPLGYVEGPHDARTKPTSILSILKRMLAWGPRSVKALKEPVQAPAYLLAPLLSLHRAT